MTRGGIAHSLGMKITAWLLCFLTLTLAICSAGLIIYMFDYGFYTSSEEAVRESYIDSLMYEDCMLAGNYYIFGYEDIGDRYKYRNFLFTITLEDDTVVADSYGGGEYLYSYDLRFTHEGVVGEGKTGVITGGRRPDDGESFTVRGYVPADMDEIDGYTAIFKWVNLGFKHRILICVIFFLLLLASVSLFIYLLSAAGHRRGREGIVIGPLEKIPLDLYAGAALLFNSLVLSYIGYQYSDIDRLIIGCVLFVADYILISGLCISFAARLKAGGVFRNTVLWILARFFVRIARGAFRLIASFIRNLPLLWKTILGILSLGAWGFLLLIIASDGNPEVAYLLAIFSFLFAAVAALIVTINLHKIKKGGELLASGDLNAKIDTGNMFWDFKRHAETLNCIGDGMTAAVEERIKSERFRTELITNVSHDLKTPLTSIINYVDLLKKEAPENERAKGYIEVLDRQASRLRKLTEDLVDASKASTGNITIELARCELGELLMQAAGEYCERLTSANLELLTAIPEESVIIMADGRHLWRVIDNLMNNILKYAQPSTRVYLNLEKKGKTAVITFRNTSKYALNISSEELMERFVRGDASRHTEGSGLGLSIARSLVELQRGAMHITVDGDLFKVVLVFDIE